MTNGGIVHRQEAQRRGSVNPDPLRGRFEEQAILRFRLSQRLLNPRRDCHVEHERKNRDQFSVFVIERGVVPLAMNNLTELVVITIARNAVTFLPLVLPVAHLVDGFEVIGNYKLPIAETLAEHLARVPSEESLRSG